jgi:hypothetical protein
VFGAGNVDFYNYVGGNPANYRGAVGQTSNPIIFQGWWCGPELDLAFHTRRTVVDSVFGISEMPEIGRLLVVGWVQLKK